MDIFSDDYFICWPLFFEWSRKLVDERFWQITEKETMPKETGLRGLMLMTLKIFLGSGEDMREQCVSEDGLFLVPR